MTPFAAEYSINADIAPVTYIGRVMDNLCASYASVGLNNLNYEQAPHRNDQEGRKEGQGEHPRRLRKEDAGIRGQEAPGIREEKEIMEHVVMKPTILFDMDGVLADFFGSAFELVSKATGFDPWMIHLYREHHGSHRMEEYFGITRGEFWRIIDEDREFWLNLEPLRHGVEAFRKLNSDPRFKVFVCTAPSSNPNCLTGKAKWLKKRLRIGVDQVVFTTEKWLLANPHALLIDDYEKNIDPFLANGGNALHLPASWNTDTSNLDLYSMIVESAEDHYCQLKNEIPSR